MQKTHLFLGGDFVVEFPPEQTRRQRADGARRSAAERRTLAGVLAKFAAFGPDFMIEERGDDEQCEREPL